MSAYGRSRTASGANAWSSGSANAAVLPVPVAACPSTSRPASIGGMARRWMGVGSSYPSSASAARSSARRPRPLNPTSATTSVVSSSMRDSHSGRPGKPARRTGPLAGPERSRSGQRGHMRLVGGRSSAHRNVRVGARGRRVEAPPACQVRLATTATKGQRIMTFNELGLVEPLLRAIRDEGYETPTPIQTDAIPQVLAGKDLLGIAQTGTGKTAAFALPVLQRLAAEKKTPRAKQPRALILTPTRELAIQIDESFRAYGRHIGLRSTVVFGGVGQHPQVQAMARGVDILTA